MTEHLFEQNSTSVSTDIVHCRSLDRRRGGNGGQCRLHGGS